MKSLKQLAVMAVCCLMLVGCGDKKEEKTSNKGDNDTKTSQVSLENDLCAKCGCCADCDTCCSEEAEKCECGFNKGSELCCKDGMKPADGTYCKGCGNMKGSEACCKEGAEVCTKCNLHKGSDLCCKLSAKDGDKDEEGHHENDGDGDGHDHDDKDGNHEHDEDHK